MLRDAGFSRVYDRWQLRDPADETGLRRIAVALVRAAPPFKLLADALVPGCSYAAVK